MRFLTIATAALSIAAVTSAVASIDPAAVGKGGVMNAASVSAKAAYPVQAQRRVRGQECREDLGYGRTGSYGCG